MLGNKTPRDICDPRIVENTASHEESIRIRVLGVPGQLDDDFVRELRSVVDCEIRPVYNSDQEFERPVWQLPNGAKFGGCILRREPTTFDLMALAIPIDRIEARCRVTGPAETELNRNEVLGIVGDRVICAASYTPLPKLVQHYSIKAK